MTRFIGSLVVAFALVALTMAAPAGQTATPPQAKAITTAGTVTAVATDSLTVKGKTDSLTFTIDKETTVVAKGATHKSLELKKEGKSAKLTEFVKVGDAVTVTYHDRGATKHAENIRVTASIK
jgi:hypothetical protein